MSRFGVFNREITDYRSSCQLEAQVQREIKDLLKLDNYEPTINASPVTSNFLQQHSNIIRDISRNQSFNFNRL
jgi:hypothetical protein